MLLYVLLIRLPLEFKSKPNRVNLSPELQIRRYGPLPLYPTMIFFPQVCSIDLLFFWFKSKQHLFSSIDGGDFTTLFTKNCANSARLVYDKIRDIE